MTVVEKILPLEREYFLWLNNVHSPFWDSFMWLYTGKIIWIPLALVALFIFCYKQKWRETILLLVFITLLITLCDQISSGLIKPYFERLRPSRHPDFEHFVSIVNGYKGGRYGFVSSHATNGFGMALFTSLLFKYRPYTIMIFLWAAINSYSRIYLGVHFISDIIGGIVLGISLALLVYYLYQMARRKLFNLSDEDLKKPIFSYRKAQVLIFTFAVLILTIFINSFITLYLKVSLFV